MGRLPQAADAATAYPRGGYYGSLVLLRRQRRVPRAIPPLLPYPVRRTLPQQEIELGRPRRIPRTKHRHQRPRAMGHVR